MGFDKTTVVVDGTTVVRRTASLLARLVEWPVEVGPGSSGLPTTREDPAGTGPLAAVAAGVEHLRRGGYRGGALVVAGDLPFLSSALLEMLLSWPSSTSVVPVVDGRVQPLCARWSSRDLDEAVVRVARGERSLRHVARGRDATWLRAEQWSTVADLECFVDIDTLEDLALLGLRAPNGETG